MTSLVFMTALHIPNPNPNPPGHSRCLPNPNPNPNPPGHVQGKYYFNKLIRIMIATEIQAVDFETALKRIIQTSNSDSLLAKGIHEVSKALESKD